MPITRNLSNFYVSESFNRLLQLDPNDGKSLLGGFGNFTGDIKLTGSLEIGSRFKTNLPDSTSIAIYAHPNTTVPIIENETNNTSASLALLEFGIVSPSGSPAYAGTSGVGTFYVNTVTGDLFVYTFVASGSRASGSTRPAPTSGTSGISGAAGTSGTSGISGATGTSGTSGAGGATGTSGTSGAGGATGTSGTSGAGGATGTSGTSGAVGTSGTAGTSGVVGTSGTSGIGSSGTSGTSGDTGTSGTSGGTGTAGTSGAVGTSGTSGAVGTSGTSGAVGTSGTSGIGSSGTSGTSGIGSSGTSGTSGDTGTSGTSGGTGTSGTSGAVGTSGTSGAVGTSGTSGTSGQSGTSGTSGQSGTSGTSGQSGTSGTSGQSGTSGTSGQSGTSGTSGQSGTSGTSGTAGSTGTSGTAGSTGTSGTAGSSGTAGAVATGSAFISSYSVGDGTNIRFRLDHETGNTEVAVNTFYAANTFEQVLSDVFYLSTGSVVLNFYPTILDVNEVSASILNIGTTKYSQVIGDGINTEYNINHGYNSKDIMVFVYQSGSANAIVYPDINLTNTNDIDIVFGVAPNVNEYIAVVVPYTGSLGTVYTELIGDNNNTAFDITHNINSRHVFTTVRSNVPPYEIVYPSIYHDTPNKITVEFENPPATNEYTVNIIG